MGGDQVIKRHKEKKYCYIYKTTNLINGKIYVGQRRSDENPEIDKYLGSGLLLQKAIKRYGLENFKKEILEICKSILDLDDRERYYIKNLNSTQPCGYNITPGGEGGFISSEKYNEISLRRKGEKHTIEHHKKVIETKKRNGTIFHSSETKDKISKSLLDTNKDLKVRYSHANYGDKNGFYKKTHNKETIKILSEKAKKRRKVQCKICNKLIVCSAISRHEKSCGVIVEKIYKLPSEDKRRSIERSNYIKLNNPMLTTKGVLNYKESYKNRSNLICPHCNFSGKGITMYRYHFDNCKHRKGFIPKVSKIYTCEFCEVNSLSKSNMTRFHGVNCKNRI